MSDWKHLVSAAGFRSKAELADALGLSADTVYRWKEPPTYVRAYLHVAAIAVDVDKERERRQRMVLELERLVEEWR